MSVITPYASRLFGALSGIRCQLRLVRNHLAPLLGGLLAIPLVLFPDPGIGEGAESNSPPLRPSQVEFTNLQQLLRTTLQIQEQLRGMQLAVEQTRQQANDAATQSAAALSNGLQVLQKAFSAQRTHEVKAMQSSNQAMLIGACTFAGASSLVMLMMIYLQWRTSNSLAAISGALPINRGMGSTSHAPALNAGWPRATGDLIGESNSRLLGALEQLDKRIDDVKRAISFNGNGGLGAAADCGSALTGSDSSQPDEHARIWMLLNKAQVMMNLEDPEAAVVCFDEVLALDPNHTGALVKKGAALERLQKLNEAIECYDRAIALDGSMTTAYLHKGGLCNRLERFKEALQCYEKALHTHDQRSS